MPKEPWNTSVLGTVVALRGKEKGWTVYEIRTRGMPAQRVLLYVPVEWADTSYRVAHAFRFMWNFKYNNIPGLPPNQLDIELRHAADLEGAGADMECEGRRSSDTITPTSAHVRG